METIEIIVNKKLVNAKVGSTILSALTEIGIKIPTLCFLKKIGPLGKCRMCLVEANGKLVTACSTQISKGMIITTDSQKVKNARKTNLELILSTHNKDCDNCERNHRCELQNLCETMNLDYTNFRGEKPNFKIDKTSNSYIRDDSKCILCGRCEAICERIQSVNVICNEHRGFSTSVGYAFGDNCTSTNCVNCGQCIVNCPTGALTEKNDIPSVEHALKNKKLHVVVATAPSVRVGIAEEFGFDSGTDVEGKMISALRELGFAKVFDINFSADLTIVEEAHEFIKVYENKQKLPLFTSCCPGWVSFVKNFYPEFLPNLSTCKSPQQMFGAACKTYYAAEKNISPKDLFVVSIMPCVAKKDERLRANINATEGLDIDATLTVRELAKLIKSHNIDFAHLPEGVFDDSLGMSSGAGVIFGNSGGVMEAALRTVSDTITKKDLKEVEYKLVRGLSGIKETTINVCGNKVSIAVASGLYNARTLLDRIKSGKSHYDFVEIMACPGGCVNGGGMPIQTDYEHNNIKVVEQRAHGLYLNDQNKRYRKSHQNPKVQMLYDKIGKPGGKEAHKLFHVKQTK